MDENQLSELSDLERDFRMEQKGYGSLSLHVVGDAGTAGDESNYIGYDLHPENVEALFFDGIGIPRWESIKADDVEEQKALYMERYNVIMVEYPMIGRVSDTDAKVTFTLEEVGSLLQECGRILAQTSDPKAIRALQKLSVAANKATERQMGLEFAPRS